MKLLCSFVQDDITPLPSESVYQDGYGNRFDPAESVRDPLYVKVAALACGESRFVTVSLDLCGLGENLRSSLRSLIRGICGLKDSQFGLCATHTHAAPACGVLYYFTQNREYLLRISLLAAKAVKRALESLQEAQMRFAYGKELAFIENRRGKTEVDRRVPVCAFYGKDERLLGVIASASCHAVCICSQRISADYPSLLSAEAAKRFPGVPFLFLQGRSGDVDPLGMGKEEEEGICTRLGTEYAESVLGALEQAQSVPAIPFLQTDFAQVTFPMRYPTEEEAQKPLAKALSRFESEDAFRRRHALVDLQWYELMFSQKEAGLPPQITAPLQVALLGREIALVFLPFEVLTVTGNAVEARLKDLGIREVLVIGHGNASMGYLAPSAEAEDPTYETGGASPWYHLPRCTKETETVLLQEISAMAQKLLAE